MSVDTYRYELLSLFWCGERIPEVCSSIALYSVVNTETRLRAGVQFTAGTRNFFLLSNVQTGSEVHQASYSMDTGGYSAGGKAAEA
jgi:hypothetical protein